MTIRQQMQSFVVQRPAPLHLDHLSPVVLQQKAVFRV